MNVIGRGPARSLRRMVAITVFSLLTVGLVAVSGTPAMADTDPPAGTPATVSADALPTWQINGVVWSQVVVGNTVYVTGSFTKARPPGVAAGGAGEVDANNVFAYDIRTGNRVTSFSHNLNGQGLVIAASPDGSRVYVGGDFTTVDGAARNHVAAFDTATGGLSGAFAPSLSGEVSALAVSPTSVYVGGDFLSANGTNRERLAAFAPSTGAMTSWVPAADRVVRAMIMSPDGSRVIAGGSFTTLNNVSAYGMGAVDATTGATLPWAANQTILDAGPNGGITSLSADANQIYGSGYAFGSGSSFEGAFAADPSTGNINWLNDCHGDTYGTFPMGQVLYTVSHAHNCSAIGSFFQSDPWSVNMRHALAFTTYPTGHNVGPDDYGWNYNGIPASSLLQWFPELSIGSYTGQSQAAWSVTGNASYVVLGGEFPRVNGPSQQGLTRFAVRSLATNKRGPVSADSAPAPSAFAVGASQVRVGWQAAYDMDNATLTYKVYRSGTTAPVATFTQDSSYWNYPSMGFRDVGLAPGATYTYTIKVTDPLGNLLTLPTTSPVTVSTVPPSAYSNDVAADGASHYWRLGEPSGSAVYDYAGFDDMAANAAVTRGTAGAINGDPDGASSFDGNSGFATTQSAVPGPNVFSEEAWFRTTSTTGGKIVSFGDQKTGNSSNYDRHIYMDPSGHVWFGVWNNGAYTVNTSTALNDGQWHHAVGTLDGSGVILYVDGKRVGRNAGTTTAQPYSGYWRIGGDSAWNGNPYFNGDIDDVAIYPTSLSLAQVQTHFTDSGRTVNIPPKPTDSYGKAVYNSGPDLYWRLGDLSGPAAKDVTTNEADGVYSGGVSYGAPGAVSGTSDAAVTLDGVDGAVAGSAAVTNPTVYSEELWFNTTTTRGGKLIGFGNAQFGHSSGYDRHVYMFDDGRLRFGVWTGQPNVIDTPASYNDGKWHHLVATQGPDGMKLYVDGLVVGTNPQTQAQDYTGYWRVGGDTTWGGNSSDYFAGSIDEVAVYSSALSAATVAAHYKAGGGTLPNQAPTASFTAAASGLKVSFDGSASSDPDGTIASYAWDFGDGTTAAVGTPTHTYAAAGTYTVALTVTDDSGATSVTSRALTVTNTAPTSAFTSSASALQVAFDGSASSDPDGTIVSYAWDFGDGTSSTGAKPSHTYPGSGTFTVSLTVTDNAGGTGTTTQSVTVAANRPPVAAFTSSSAGLVASLDASGSSDPDGSIASYAWDFGDGTSGTGVTTSHTYAAAGDFTVTLTVTDNATATSSISHTVTVAQPGPRPIASDGFARVVAKGWGNADLGGTWTLTGSSSNASVNNGTASLKMATAGAGMTESLSSVSSTDTDLQVAFSLDKMPTGGGTYLSFIGRSVAGVGDYRAKVHILSSGQVNIAISRFSGNTEVATVPDTKVAGLTYTAGQSLHVRFVATGVSPTTLRAKVWADGTTEPAAWQVAATDSTAALQVNGSVGLANYLSGTATNAPQVSMFTSFQVYAASTMPQAAKQNLPAAKPLAPVQ